MKLRAFTKKEKERFKSAAEVDKVHQIKLIEIDAKKPIQYSFDYSRYKVRYYLGILSNLLVSLMNPNQVLKKSNDLLDKVKNNPECHRQIKDCLNEMFLWVIRLANLSHFKLYFTSDDPEFEFFEHEIKTSSLSELIERINDHIVDMHGLYYILLELKDRFDIPAKDFDTILKREVIKFVD